MRTFKICILSLLIVASCALAACEKQSTEKKQLDSPSQLHTVGSTLVWDKVENATGYVVFCRDEEYETKINSYNLSYLTDPGTYEVEVLAMGDGEHFLNSERAKYSYTVIKETKPQPAPTKGLEYTLLKDGSGYEVARGEADLTGTIVIPDYHEGLPVKKISAGGFRICVILEIKINTITTGLCLPSTLEEIGNGAFEKFYSLTEIIIPDSVKSIGSCVFMDNVNLKKVYLPQGLKTIGGWAFRNCKKLDRITFPETIESIGEDVMSGTAWLGDQPKGFAVKDDIILDYVGEPEREITIPSARLISNEFFRENLTIETVKIPDARLCSYGLFYKCEGLKTVFLPDNLTVIPSDCFSGCKSLKSISLPDGLKKIGKGAFQDCLSLTSVDFPDTLETIGVMAFSGSGLTSITLHGNIVFETEEYSTVAGKKSVSCAFAECADLKEVRIQGVKELPDGLFVVCSSLGKVIVEPGTLVIGEAFQSCESLKGIEIPDTVITLVGTFRNCGNLTNVKLPGALETIEKNLFRNCTSLKQIEIPDTVREIEEGAFRGSGLESVELPEELRIIGAQAFSETVFSSIT